VARESFTYADFTEGYLDFEEVVAEGYVRAQGAFEALERDCRFLNRRGIPRALGL
jgi:hypothetical protein